jgi:hypothetical protein
VNSDHFLLCAKFLSMSRNFKFKAEKRRSVLSVVSTFLRACYNAKSCKGRLQKASGCEGRGRVRHSKLQNLFHVQFPVGKLQKIYCNPPLALPTQPHPLLRTAPKMTPQQVLKLVLLTAHYVKHFSGFSFLRRQLKSNVVSFDF